MARAIYKTGSQCILPNSNDKDYCYYFDTNEERLQALERNHDHEKDIHFVLWSNRLRIFLGCYIYPFMEYVEGEEIQEFATFNICEHKKEYKELALKYIDVMKDDSKKWYHILIACYMFERNKNSIVKAQKQTAQQVHDNGITKELKEYCINILNEIE